MTKKIFRAIFTASFFTLLVSLVIIMAALYNYFTDVTDKQLSTQLHFAVQAVNNEGEEYLKGLSENDYRLTLIDSNGDIIYDNTADSSVMENHMDREEIKEALKYGKGKSCRFSSTLMEKTIYFSERLSDGNVLRISASQDSVILLLIGIMPPILIVFVVSIIFCSAVAKKMSERIVKPLNSLDLKNPLENDVYDEVAPLLTHIYQQNKKIDVQIDELKKSREEFETIIKNMNEGLALIGESGKIIAINRAAQKIFNSDSGCIGRDFLYMEKSADMIRAVKKAEKKGHSEFIRSKNGREYQININRTESDKYGLIILAFDITDKIFAERNRREFTANVSHELKTPLQSIMGSAELIESGLVKNEDIAGFAGKIHKEATRLVSLINDIINLSQLDEKIDMKFEDIDLFDIAAEVVESLSISAKEKNIVLSLSGESCIINAVPRLVYEIIYNLCENAVKYNKDNGSISVIAEPYNNNARLIVKDTGIGIPAEHRARVFERFYRVDKSHSGKTGGTGLGLSIVKHAVQYLGATIELKSEVEKGTEIEVIFDRRTCY